MAHKTGGGSTRKNRDSISKRLGVKVYGGQNIRVGEIIVRQKGTKFHPGVGTKLGNDFTVYAISSGKVEFKTKLGKKIINVVSVL